MKKYIKTIIYIILVAIIGYFIQQQYQKNMVLIKHNQTKENKFNTTTTEKDNVVIQCNTCGGNCCAWFGECCSCIPTGQGNCGLCEGYDCACANDNCIGDSCYIECGTGYTQTGCGTCTADDQQNGASCGSNSECASGTCINGLCEPCIGCPSDTSCTNNGQCCSGYICSSLQCVTSEGIC